MQTEPIQIPLQATDEVTGVVRKVTGSLDGLDDAAEKVKESGSKMASGSQAAIGSFTELSSAIGIAKQVIGTAKDVFDSTYGAFASYAETVRDLSIATGTSAEETSVLIQTLDDFGVSAENIQTAARAMKEQGIVPTIESLAQLSDQFLAIEDPAKRLEFAQKNLGRSYKDFLNTLSQGGDVIRENADGVNQMLVLTDEQIRQSEMARLALDNLSDSWEGLKVSIGAAVGEMIAGVDALQQDKKAYEELTGQTLEFSRAQGEATKNFEAFRGQMARGAAMTEYYTKQADAATAATDGLGAVAETNWGSVLSTTMQLSNQQQQYNEKMAEYSATLADLQTKQSATKVGSDEFNELQGKIDETKGKMAELGAESEKATNQMIFGMLQAKMAADGLSSVEFDSLIRIGEGMGLISENAAETATALNAFTDKIAEAGSSSDTTSGKMAEIIEQAQILAKLTGKPMKFFIDIAVTGSFPAMPGANTTNTPHVTENSGRASGGPLAERGWTLVGDKPGGQLTPWSELISPSGYVFDSKTTRALIKSGMVGGFKSRAEGGTMSAVGQKGDYGQYTPKPTPSKSQDEEIISSATAPMEARAEQNSTAIAQMQVAINTIQAALQDNAAAYDNLAAILTNQNPRAIGKAVAFELSKKFS